MAGLFNVTVGPGWKKTIVFKGKGKGLISMKFTSKSVDAVFRRAAKKGEVSVRAAMAQMNLESEEAMTHAKLLIPVDTAAAQSTGVVIPPTDDLKRGPVMSFGRRGVINPKTGKEVDYTADLHEDTEKFHQNGEAKFLQTAITVQKRGMVKRLAKAARL